jgi:hypothetical protein
MDGQTTVEDVAAVAALVQTLASLELERRDHPEPLPRTVELIEENRFLAARGGMAALLIDVRSRRRIPAIEQLELILGACRRHARRLRCEREIASVRRRRSRLRDGRRSQVDGRQGRSPSVRTRRLRPDRRRRPAQLAPMLRRIPARLDRITAAMERNEWGYNIRLLAHEDDLRLAQRVFARATVAFLSAAIGLVSALLIGVDDGILVASGVTLAQALGYLGLLVATVLGMRVLVAISRDRVI